ncbi:MAG: O-antigen ligase family protein [Candidatus Sumerlaeota bacterium]|nr:O-antigen ligase family protein [Candidatus Sumerlaeota bacterium]
MSEPPSSLPDSEASSPLSSVFRVPDTAALLLIGFCGVAVAGCFDQKIFNWPADLQAGHMNYCFLFLAVVLLADREGPLRRRLWATGAAAVATLGWTALAINSTAHYTYGFLLNLTALGSMAPYVWLAALWLASPIWLDSRRYSRTFRAAVVALSVYGAFCFASAVSSFSPAKALPDFIKERAVYLALVFAWLRAAQASPWLRTHSGRVVLRFAAAVMAVAALIGIVDHFAGSALRDQLAGLTLVMASDHESEGILPPRRLVFPMRDFNRTGFLGMAVTLLILLAHVRDNKKGVLERWGFLFAFPAFLATLFTYTRGAILGVVLGIGLWCVLASRRMLIVALIGFAALIVFLPREQRNYVLSVFRRDTYTFHSNYMTTMQQRYLAWRWGWGKIGEFPLTGMGYGEKMTRYQYDTYVQSVKTPENRAILASGHVINHMHNLWLETAVESGLPALAALAAFCGARWLLLARWFLRSRGLGRRRAAAWIGLEFAFLVFGMIFYMLKDMHGLWYWMPWAYSLSESEAATRTADCGLSIAA